MHAAGERVGPVVDERTWVVLVAHLTERLRFDVADTPVDVRVVAAHGVATFRVPPTPALTLEQAIAATTTVPAASGDAGAWLVIDEVAPPASGRAHLTVRIADGAIVRVDDARDERRVELERALSALAARAQGAVSAPLGALGLVRLEDADALARFGGQPTPPPRTTVLARLEERAARDGDRVAVTDARGETSLAGLLQRARALTVLLAEHEVGPGSMVAVHLGRTANYVAALLACWMRRAAVVPLDPTYPSVRLAAMADAAGCTLVLHDDAGTFPGTTTLPTLAVDEPADDAATLALGLDAFRLTPAWDELAYVFFTSGSEGAPKGARIPHHALVNQLDAFQETIGLHADDLVCAATSFSFDPSLVELFWPLVTGARLLVAGDDERLDAHRLRALYDAHPVTMLGGTPTAWRRLVEAGFRARPGTRCLVGGEALTSDLVRGLLGAEGEASGTSTRVEIWNLYGPTETTVWASALRACPAAHVGVRTPVGGPLPGYVFRVQDVCGQPAPLGVPGELYVGGSPVGLGYVGRDELSRDRFVTDPAADMPGRWYRTGDMVAWREDGALDFLGRRDRQVKLRGVRIELDEVEAALRDVAAAARAGVSGVTAAVQRVEGEDVLVAYLAGPELPSERDVRSELAARLPVSMLPSAFVHLDELPTTPSGKVDRSRLPAPAPPTFGSRAPGASAAPPHWANRDTLAAAGRLVRLLAVVRPNDPPHDWAADDDVTALGSLALMALHRKVETELRVRIAIVDWLSAVTFGELVALVAAAGMAGDEPAASLLGRGRAMIATLWKRGG